MQIKDIKTLVARLGAIVDGWDEQSGAPAVERHIAASLLAELYEAVKFDTALAATEIVKEVAMPAPVEEPSDETVEEESSEEVAQIIDLSDIFGGSFDDEPEQTEEIEEPAEEIEEEIAEQPIAVEQPEEQPAEEVVEEVVEIPAVEEKPIVVEEEVATPIEEPAPIEEEIEETISPEVEAEVAPAIEETSPAEVEVVAPAVEEESPAEVEVVAPAVEEEKPIEVEEEKPAEVEEEKPESKQTSLFDMEVVRRPRSSSSRRVIMSLYGGSVPESRSDEKVEKPTEPKPVEPTPAPIEEPEKPEPQKEEQHIESATVAPVSVAERIAAAQAETQSQQVLGDVIGAGTTTLAEAVAASQPIVQTVQNDRVNSLRNALGINDRFILIRDLFGGDGEAFERAIDELDAFEDFNECLVYMSAYRWNPNCDGARMLMDLVTRKLL
ncbi:MAG: hypothetical protein IIU53_01860 [Rikenellaceae bacterium]|nr:hypothetical protein [Rikenellaceae bacterium]